jgi:hypothetical protein
VSPSKRLAALTLLVAAMPALASAALGCAAGERQTSARAVRPTAPAARPAPPPSNIDLAQKCAADADCSRGEVCQSVIRAACETCDGGPVVQICQPARTCGDDSNCQAPRKCVEVECPTCLNGKAGECR